MQKNLVLIAFNEGDDNSSVELTQDCLPHLRQILAQATLAAGNLAHLPASKFCLSVEGKMPGISWDTPEYQEIAVFPTGFVKFSTEEFMTMSIKIADLEAFFKGKITPALNECIYWEDIEQPDNENDGFITRGLGGAWILTVRGKFIGSFPDLDALLENLPDNWNTFYQSLWIVEKDESMTRIDEQGNPLGE